MQDELNHVSSVPQKFTLYVDKGSANCERIHERSHIGLTTLYITYTNTNILCCCS